MTDPLDPPAGWDEAPAHPGIQCYEAHPDRPHKRPWPAGVARPPAGASQTYVYAPAARRELVAQARLIARLSTSPQWIHEHRHGAPCHTGCGPLEAVTLAAGVPA